MDTIILILLAGTFALAIREKRVPRVVLAWAVCLVLALLLFNHHVSSSLDLNF